MNYLITHKLQGNLTLSTINLTKYLEILFDVEDIEEDSDDQDFKSEEGDPDMEDIHENVRDMTA